MANFDGLIFRDSPAVDSDYNRYLVEDASILRTVSFKEDMVRTMQNKTLDSALEQICAVNDHDLQVMPAKKTESSTVRPLRPLRLASTIHSICESQHITSSTVPLNLANNPLFKELQATLLDECKRNALPSTLIDMCKSQYTMDVYTRERDIQKKFDLLQMPFPQESNQLLGVFKHYFAMIEAERFKLLQESNICSYHASINRDLHKIMDRVETSLKLLEKAAKDSSSTRYMPYRPCKMPKHLHSAVKFMEEWPNNYEHPYTSPAVQAIAKPGCISNQIV